MRNEEIKLSGSEKPPKPGATVLVAMSGGVDSSVAAFLLKKAGYQVVGLTLKTWTKELCDTVPKGQTCCSAGDIEDAQAVAHRLGIPFYVAEVANAFESNVMDYFVDAYSQGLTPNPCVVCNRRIKLGFLLEKARALGAEYVATGHYASVVWNDQSQRYAIEQAVDLQKDQSYVLYQLTQEQMGSLLLPVGDLTKAQVRAYAQEAGLSVAQKPESMELCFIPDGDTQGFLRSKAPEAFTPGEIVNRQGEVLGEHQGIAAYTVGQRKGLGLAHPTPLYVLEIQPQTRRVVVGEADELAAQSCRVEKISWMGVSSLLESREVGVKIRHHSEKYPARITPNGDSVEVKFLEPVAGGVSPGQAAVFYEGNRVLGGGWIAKNPEVRTEKKESVARCPEPSL